MRRVILLRFSTFLVLAVAAVALACTTEGRPSGGWDVVVPEEPDSIGLRPRLDPERLPVGDGKVSSEPVAGSVWACQRAFPQRNIHTGPWLNGDGTYDSRKLVLVAGEVAWPSQLSVALNGERRTISGNGLPDHPTGGFPAERYSNAFALDPNPNSILSQRVTLDLPAVPSLAPQPSCLPMGPVGVMLSGAVFFNALDAAGLDAVAHEVRDLCGGHPQGTGLYHYHAHSTCFDDFSFGHSKLLGYAFDGFGLFGRRGESRDPLTNADLDACHGHIHSVPWDGQWRDLYHYHATDEYPYLIGCYRGTPGTVSVQPAEPVPGRPRPVGPRAGPVR